MSCYVLCGILQQYSFLIRRFVLLVPYLSLLVAWLLFGILHSVLATETVKQTIHLWMGQYVRYYRLCYSLLATGLLVIVLYYHYSFDALLLWQTSLIEKIIAVILLTAGSCVMLLCINTYFMDLSGIDALMGRKRKFVLQTKGMHSYVRHPLYSGTILFVWALFLYQPYLNTLISAVCITVYTVIGIRFEEKKLIREYGDDYRAYQLKTPSLIPQIDIQIKGIK